MKETITKISETKAEFLIPNEPTKFERSIEEQQYIIQAINESIGNYTNEIQKLQEKLTIEEARLAGMVNKGVISEAEDREIKEEARKAEEAKKEEEAEKELEVEVLEEKEIEK